MTRNRGSKWFGFVRKSKQSPSPGNAPVARDTDDAGIPPASASSPWSSSGASTSTNTSTPTQSKSSIFEKARHLFGQHGGKTKAAGRSKASGTDMCGIFSMLCGGVDSGAKDTDDAVQDEVIELTERSEFDHVYTTSREQDAWYRAESMKIEKVKLERKAKEISAWCEAYDKEQAKKNYVFPEGYEYDHDLNLHTNKRLAFYYLYDKEIHQPILKRHSKSISELAAVCDLAVRVQNERVQRDPKFARYVAYRNKRSAQDFDRKQGRYILRNASLGPATA